MAYTSQEEIEKAVGAGRLLTLTDRDNGGTADPNVIKAAIAFADTRIDAFAGNFYITPFDPVPEMIASIALDLAVYYLYKDNAESNEGRYKVVKDGYDEAMKLLKDIGVGRLQVVGGVPVGDDGETTGGGGRVGRGRTATALPRSSWS
jgi:phage gp36-like protein